MKLDREEEAWNLIQSAIPSPEEQGPEHVPIFVNWVYLMIELNKWHLWRKMEARVKKFLRSLTDKEDKNFAVETLMNEHTEYFNSCEYKAAEVFINLAMVLDGDLFEQLLERETMWKVPETE
ncbi:hypothetical protein [Effusibacillus dendaii]|nr:hypothetical protein [Effusibacillus dendaii]